MKSLALFALLVVATPAIAAGHDAMVNELYDSASRAFEDGDFTKAVADLTASIGKSPTARAYQMRGDAYVRLGQIDQARADYEKVLTLEKNPKLRASVQHLLKELATAMRARLNLASDPPGATIYVDLKAEGSKGKTPTTIVVAPGRHRVMMELDGYEPFLQKDVTAIDNQEVNVAATLVLRGCDLRVASVPNARVVLDGAAGIAVPFTKRVKAGEHSLQISASGYEAREQRVTCVIGTPLQINADLQPIARAHIELTIATPPGGEVRLDGQAATGTSYDVAPGGHALEVAADGHATWKTNVQLAAGQSLALAPLLVAQPPSIAAKKSVARSWWLWTSIAIVVAGAAVGVGVGVGLASRTSRVDVIKVLGN